MSYSEENGQVVLKLSIEDYELVIMLLGAGSAVMPIPLHAALALMNRLNEGNPHYTPYNLPAPKET